MFIGYMGDIIFAVSEIYLLTPTDYSRESAGRWTEHALMLRKPVSQFGGPGLEKLHFSIILDADHGIDVEAQLKKLRIMRDTGAVFPLIIGGQPVTQSFWRLDSLRESGHKWAGDGTLIQCKPELHLTEYDDANYIEETSLMANYGKVYNLSGAQAGGK